MSSEVKMLKGRTGYVRKIISDRKAIFWDAVYKDVIFTEDMVICPLEDKTNYFREAFHVNRQVYYDLEINKGKVKCLSIWVGKKNTLSVTGSSSPTKIDSPSHTATGDLSLEEGTIYKAIVTRIRPPFVCIADIEDIPVFIFNSSFMPTPTSPKLRREEPLVCFLKKGDTVYVKVKRCGPDKEFQWTAWDAWKANIPSPKGKKNVQHVNKDIFLKLQNSERKMIGKLTFICYRTGHLISSKFSEPVVFHRENAFLYGIPLKSIGLDTVFTKGTTGRLHYNKFRSFRPGCIKNR